jgi:hypothetical protein
MKAGGSWLFGLALVKGAAVLLAVCCLRWGRLRLLRGVNAFFAVLVAWNVLIVILSSPSLGLVWRASADSKMTPRGEFKAPAGTFKPSKNPPLQGAKGEFTPPKGEFKAPPGEFKAPQGQFKSEQGQFKAPQGQFKTPQGEFKTPQGEFKPTKKASEKR